MRVNIREPLGSGPLPLIFPTAVTNTDSHNHISYIYLPPIDTSSFYPVQPHSHPQALKMSHTYVSVTPNSPSLPDGVAQFFETFYATSDTPDAHERYVDSFTKDADFIMASKRAKGSAGKFASSLLFPSPVPHGLILIRFSF